MLATQAARSFGIYELAVLILPYPISVNYVIFRNPVSIKHGGFFRRPNTRNSHRFFYLFC